MGSVRPVRQSPYPQVMVHQLSGQCARVRCRFRAWGRTALRALAASFCAAWKTSAGRPMIVAWLPFPGALTSGEGRVCYVDNGYLPGHGQETAEDVRHGRAAPVRTDRRVLGSRQGRAGREGRCASCCLPAPSTASPRPDGRPRAVVSGLGDPRGPAAVGGDGAVCGRGDGRGPDLSERAVRCRAGWQERPVPQRGVRRGVSGCPSGPRALRERDVPAGAMRICGLPTTGWA